MTAKPVTMAELFTRRRAEAIAEYEAQKAWEATPEGAQWREERDAYHKRMAEADAQFARDHPVAPEEDNDIEENDEC